MEPGTPIGGWPAAPPVPLQTGGGGGLARLLAPQGSWSSRTTSSHPFHGLQALLESSILGRLMSQAGKEGSEIRGLDGGAVAWNHLENPYGRMETTTNTWQPAAVRPPRKNRLAPQLENFFANGPQTAVRTGNNSQGIPTTQTAWRTGFLSNGMPSPFAVLEPFPGGA